MKQIYTILVAILLTSSVFAQAPEKMSYQAVIRNSTNQLVTNHAVGMQISILQGTSTGTAIYVETQTTTSNTNGLITVEIGGTNATVVSGDFASINWSNNTYFIKTETDPTGGTAYTITGISQLMSVAYALHAKTADNTFSGNYGDLANTPDLTNFDQDASDDFDGQYSNLTGTPTNVSDFTNDAGYITTFSEVDGSITNEIQDLQLNGNILSITNKGTATEIDLSSYLDNTDTQLTDVEITKMGYIKNAADADADASNEIQDLQLNGNILSITNKGTATEIDLSSYLDNTDIQLTDVEITKMGFIKNADDNDADASNEIQNLSQVLTQSNDGGAKQIKNIADPSEDQDAATKAYVDLLEARIEVLELPHMRVTDIDGNTYKMVKIGNKIWMAENLKVTHYPNGDAIPLVIDNAAWGNLSDDDTADAYSYYNNNASSEADTYGALYTYAAAIGDNWARDNIENQGVCPDGWHMPTNADWEALKTFLGENSGSKLAGNAALWTDGELEQSADFGTTGFSGLPNGYRSSSSGAFYSLGKFGYWWSSNAEGGYFRVISYRYINLSNSYSSKSLGYSVRCVKN